jgi:peptidoglycan/LPS O-acetylase OafA/YrhL
MSSPAPERLRPRHAHFGRIDVLRAAAFLMVFFYHFVINIPNWDLPWNGLVRDYAGWLGPQILLLPAVFGWLGVALFFVISGFCIHFSVLTLADAFRVGDFYQRRFFRIYPAYFINVVICLFLSHWLTYPRGTLRQIAVHFIMLHNLSAGAFFQINPVIWSLGVEWQFYLLVPLLLWGRKRWGLPACFAVACAINIIGQLYLSLRYELPDVPVSSNWSFPLITWCDWILGACLAEALVNKKPLFPRNTAVLVASFLLLLVAVNFKLLNVQTYFISSVFFAALMERYLALTSPLLRLERLLVPIGLISYSLYLWHGPVINLAITAGAAPHVALTPLTDWLIYFPLILAATMGISFLSYRYIEVGVPLAWHRWRKSRATVIPSIVIEATEPAPASPR